MQSNINIPIPILIFFLTTTFAIFLSIIGIVTWFFRNLHMDMKEAIKGLSAVVHGLEIISSTIETKHNHILERVQSLEKDNDYTDKEYRASLDWLKTHVSALERLIAV